MALNMKSRKKIFLLLTFLMIKIFIYAEPDNYAWLNEYNIITEEQLNFQHFMTFSYFSANHQENKISAEHKVKIETGIKDNIGIAIYQTLNQNFNENLKYNGYRLKLSYKFGEKNKNIFDFLGSIEYKRNIEQGEHIIGLNVIIAKDITNFNVTLNSGYNIGKKSEEIIKEFDYGLGMNYDFNNFFKIGIEVIGNLKKIYAGPTIFLQLKRIYFIIGNLIQISNESLSPKSQFRLISGINF